MPNYDIALVPGRECGACTLCCTVMAIDKPEIQKQAGVTCRYCKAGCSIHATRPSLCRDYYCGWRKLKVLDDSWRPDRSAVMVDMEEVDGESGLSLVLVGDPFETVRQLWFIDFVAQSVRNYVPLSLGILGPPGRQGAALPITTRQMWEAAGISRDQVRALLDEELKRLLAFDFPPRVIVNKGNDVGA